ncbi:hypothetical protein Mal52_13490 [Symmachiella dynata]|uniref:Uncharacterized protein n=1 Tax=Symmachiella dynata TaxID=2527995 RepID=A0A517ZK57_9PLAN|nr:hypothetical protein [Symmachiella dynata]QDU42880.1 hypothetical protein Mal52_13490 [Symmachiella dynata]
MNSISQKNFGILIAYLIPGFTTLWGASFFSETLRAWLGASPVGAPTVGGFLYVTIGSLAAGLIVGTVRWAVIDRLHHRTGISEPAWDFARLRESVAAYDVLNELHYKYYKCYSAMFIAVAFVYVSHRLAFGFDSPPPVWTEAGLIVLESILWMASRDALHKYYTRVERLLGTESVAGARKVDPDDTDRD